MHSENSDQTGGMPRLIWFFTGHTCQFIGFVMQWLICLLMSCSFASYYRKMDVQWVSAITEQKKANSCQEMKVYFKCVSIKWATSWENLFCHMRPTKAQISLQYLYLLNPKFQDSSWLLKLSRVVWVLPGRKPWRHVFLWWGSYLTDSGLYL